MAVSLQQGLMVEENTVSVPRLIVQRIKESNASNSDIYQSTPQAAMTFRRSRQSKPSSTLRYHDRRRGFSGLCWPNGRDSGRVERLLRKLSLQSPVILSAQRMDRQEAQITRSKVEVTCRYRLAGMAFSGLVFGDPLAAGSLKHYPRQIFAVMKAESFLAYVEEDRTAHCLVSLKRQSSTLAR